VIVSEKPFIDDRPEIEPDCFMFREFRADSDFRSLKNEIVEALKIEVEWARWTLIDDEHPLPPYPNGLYFEAWIVAPWLHDPPGKEASFNFPLTRTKAATPDERT
jgi:hypothetical protein